MTEASAATGPAAPGTATRRRWLAAGLLAGAVVVQIAVGAPQWLRAVRMDATSGTVPGGLSWAAVLVDGLLWVLPPVVALVGLARARTWGPAAAVANGLLVLLPAALMLTWVRGPLDALAVGSLVSHAMLLVAAGAAATLVPWTAVTPTPARLLLWAGAGAVVAGRILPVSDQGRGVESLAASVLRFGGTALQWGTLLVGVLSLLALAVVADRLPTDHGVGAAAVLAAGGIGVLSPILATWMVGQPLSPLAGLGPVGAAALVWWLREVGRDRDLPQEPATL